MPLVFGQAALRSKYPAQLGIDLSCHVRSITAHIEIGSLLNQLVDFFCTLAQPVLNVDLLVRVARECRDQLKRIPQLSAVCLC